jgi:transposase-like protein
MMSKKPRKRYTEEFKAQAVELLRTGKPVSELAEELCVSADLLYRWKRGSQVGSEGMRAVGERFRIGPDLSAFGSSWHVSDVLLC